MNDRYDGKQQIKMFPSNCFLLDKDNIVLKGKYNYVWLGIVWLKDYRKIPIIE